MKKNFLMVGAMALTLATGMTFASCSDDDDDKIVENNDNSENNSNSDTKDDNSTVTPTPETVIPDTAWLNKEECETRLNNIGVYIFGNFDPEEQESAVALVGTLINTELPSFSKNNTINLNNLLSKHDNTEMGFKTNGKNAGDYVHNAMEYYQLSDIDAKFTVSDSVYYSPNPNSGFQMVLDKEVTGTDNDVVLSVTGSSDYYTYKSAYKLDKEVVEYENIENEKWVTYKGFPSVGDPQLHMYDYYTKDQIYDTLVSAVYIIAGQEYVTYDYYNENYKRIGYSYYAFDSEADSVSIKYKGYEPLFTYKQQPCEVNVPKNIKVSISEGSNANLAIVVDSDYEGDEFDMNATISMNNLAASLSLANVAGKNVGVGAGLSVDDKDIASVSITLDGENVPDFVQMVDDYANNRLGAFVDDYLEANAMGWFDNAATVKANFADSLYLYGKVTNVLDIVNYYNEVSDFNELVDTLNNNLYAYFYFDNVDAVIGQLIFEVVEQVDSEGNKCESLAPMIKFHDGTVVNVFSYAGDYETIFNPLIEAFQTFFSDYSQFIPEDYIAK